MENTTNTISNLTNDELLSFIKKRDFLKCINYFLTLLVMMIIAFIFTCFNSPVIPNACKGSYAETAIYASYYLSGAMLVLLTIYTILLSYGSKIKKCWYIRKAITFSSAAVCIGVLVTQEVAHSAFVKTLSTKSADFTNALGNDVTGQYSWILAAALLIFALKIFLSIFFRKYDLLSSQAESEVDKRAAAYLETENIDNVKKISKSSLKLASEKITRNFVVCAFTIFFVLYQFVGGKGVIFKTFSWTYIALIALVICWGLERLLNFFQKRNNEFKLPIRYSVVRKFLKDNAN